MCALLCLILCDPMHCNLPGLVWKAGRWPGAVTKQWAPSGVSASDPTISRRRICQFGSFRASESVRAIVCVQNVFMGILVGKPRGRIKGALWAPV